MSGPHLIRAGSVMGEEQADAGGGRLEIGRCFCAKNDDEIRCVECDDDHYLSSIYSPGSNKNEIDRIEIITRPPPSSRRDETQSFR